MDADACLALTSLTPHRSFLRASLPSSRYLPLPIPLANHSGPGCPATSGQLPTRLRFLNHFSLRTGAVQPLGACHACSGCRCHRHLPSLPRGPEHQLCTHAMLFSVAGPCCPCCCFGSCCWQLDLQHPACPLSHCYCFCHSPSLFPWYIYSKLALLAQPDQRAPHFPRKDSVVASCPLCPQLCLGWAEPAASLFTSAIFQCRARPPLLCFASFPAILGTTGCLLQPKAFVVPCLVPNPAQLAFFPTCCRAQASAKGFPWLGNDTIACSHPQGPAVLGAATLFCPCPAVKGFVFIPSFLHVCLCRPPPIQLFALSCLNRRPLY